MDLPPQNTRSSDSSDGPTRHAAELSRARLFPADACRDLEVKVLDDSPLTFGLRFASDGPWYKLRAFDGPDRRSPVR